jgi:hypothetical protein
MTCRSDRLNGLGLQMMHWRQFTTVNAANICETLATFFISKDRRLESGTA